MPSWKLQGTSKELFFQGNQHTAFHKDNVLSRMVKLHNSGPNVDTKPLVKECQVAWGTSVPICVGCRDSILHCLWILSCQSTVHDTISWVHLQFCIEAIDIWRQTLCIEVINRIGGLYPIYNLYSIFIIKTISTYSALVNCAILFYYYHYFAIRSNVSHKWI
jgi:hypothetical protein